MRRLCDSFSEAFLSLSSAQGGYSELIKKIGSSCDDGRGEALFWRFQKVMEAENASDLENISLEEMLELLDFTDIFCEVFKEKKAGSYFQAAWNKLPKCQNKRKRRIL